MDNKPIIVISLERATERRERLKEMGLEPYLMNAIDGKDLPEESLNYKIQYGWREGEFLKPGEVGCTMSHIKALEKARDNKWPYVIILEDDIELAEDWERRIKILFSIIPGDWEHVYLSGIPRFGLSFLPNLAFPNVVRTCFTECTHSMIIRASAYTRVIKRLSSFATTTDNLYNTLFDDGLTSYTYYPFISYANDKHTYIWEHDIERAHKSLLYFKSRI